MKKILLLILAVGFSMSSLSVSAATGTAGGCGREGNVNAGDSAIHTSPESWALIMIDGQYCIIWAPTVGETSLIRSMALQARASGNMLHLDYQPDPYGSANGRLHAYTVLP